jgi:hypothetical protein
MSFWVLSPTLSKFLFKDAIYFLESFYHIADIVILTYRRSSKIELQDSKMGGGIYFKMIITTEAR